MGELDAISPSSKPPSPKWKNIGVRAVTGLLIAFIAFIPLYLGGVFWPILVAIVSALAMWEWVRMTETHPTRLAYIIPIFGMVFIVIGSYVGAYKITFMIAFLLAALAGLERIRRKGAFWASLGFLYIIIPAILLIFLRGSEAGITASGFQNLIYVVLVVIAADTGAYLGGSYFQGPKMAPKLSPNKTWSGFASGIVLAGIIGALSALFLGVSPLNGAIFAVPIVIFSVLGDFLESGLKRKLDVKDTGGLLPGHGGVLDRVDSLMMAVVFVACVQVIAPQIWPI